MSLLEMLVVFTIISLVSVLLAQGFGFGMSLYNRIDTAGPALKKRALVRSWFRQVNGALVVQFEPVMTLRGTAEQIQAHSINPLKSRPGPPTEIQWSIDSGWLRYQEGEQGWAITRVDAGAAFEYRTAAGVWVDGWLPGSEEPLLPHAVRIRTDAEVITAPIMMRYEPDGLLEESRRDRN